MRFLRKEMKGNYTMYNYICSECENTFKSDTKAIYQFLYCPICGHKFGKPEIPEDCVCYVANLFDDKYHKKKCIRCYNANKPLYNLSNYEKFDDEKYNYLKDKIEKMNFYPSNTRPLDI
jgi:DNA-directed RNA polymerase subunit RPC12/RpoP